MLTNIFSDEIAYIIAMTLVHSVWQISLVAVILGFILHFNKNASNNSRYYLSLSALGVAVLLSIVTFSIYLIESGTNTINSGVVFIQPVLKNNSFSSSLFPSTTEFINKYLFVIVNTWILGSLLFFIRFTGAYMYLKHIIKKSDIQNNILNKSLKKLNKKFKINRTIEIKESGMITGPLVMGFFKPIILFPVGLLTNLSMSEVDSILAHELAHIKRHDYLFKLFQSFAEIVFYYHPGIWYISTQISFNRELCCDDLAIEYTGSSFSYAKTLVKLQEIKANKLSPALAFSGNKNHFKKRILRLLDIPVSANNGKHKILAFLLIFSTVFAFARGPGERTDPKEKFSPDIYFIDDCVQNIEEVGVYLDTIPEKSSFHIKKHSEEEELELEMKDGNITKLKIDGNEIPEDEYEKYEDILIKLSPDKGNRVITVFPDCEKDLGNIFYLDNLENEIINLDSMVDMQLKKFVFPKGNLDDFDFEFGDINKLWVDSLKNQIYGEALDKELLEQEFMLDSVFDLIPKGIFAFPKDIHKDIRIKILGDEDEDFNMEWFSEENNDIIIDLMEKEKLFDKKRRHFKHKKHEDDDNLFFFQPQNDFHLFEHNSGNVSDIIGRHLLKDRLVEPKEKSKIELSGKHMKVNGEKQPTNIWKKYKHIYEENTGLELTKKSKLEFEIKPNTRRESYIRKLI